jgi:uncharacterized protein YdhG (YjbR/CyaY superfamily)
MQMPKFATVDEYVASIPEPGRRTLEALRRIVRDAAPDAEERLSYGVCGYRLYGTLVYIGAARKHVALYAVGADIMSQYADELAPYLSGDSTIRFPLNLPLPKALVTKLVKARVAENEARVRKR